MPSAAAGAVTSTELQKSIFDHPPSSLPAPPTNSGTLKPPTGAADQAMADAKSPSTSVAGQKRRREDDEEAEDDSDEDVAMEEDSDDD
jgi:hypothetical protein